VKASVAGELLLLVGLLAVAYLLYVQQGQLVELELELDRMRGAVGSHLPPVPVASDNGEAVIPQAPKPKRSRKAAPGA
jgi:hypothetical protein